jgi:hypothetical protein
MQRAIQTVALLAVCAGAVLTTADDTLLAGGLLVAGGTYALFLADATDRPVEGHERPGRADPVD